MTTIEGQSIDITQRSYQDDDDFWRVRQLLVDTYPITPIGFNWEVRRWDGTRFHDPDHTLLPGAVASLRR